MADGAKGMGGVLFEAGQSAVKATGSQIKQAGQTVAQDVTSSLFGKPLGANPKNTTAFPFPQQKPLPQKPFSSGAFPKAPAGQLPKLDAFGGMFEKGMGGKPFGISAAQKAAEERQQAELVRISEENRQKDAIKLAELTKKLHDEIYYNKIKKAGGSLQEDWAKKQKQQEEEEEAKKQAATQQQGQAGSIAPGSFAPGKINAQPTAGGLGNQQIVRQGAHEAVKAGQ